MIDMLCPHTESKMKLVIHATRSKYGHMQGYAKARCCVKCGKVLEQQSPADKQDDADG